MLQIIHKVLDPCMFLILMALLVLTLQTLLRSVDIFEATPQLPPRQFATQKTELNQR